MEKIRSKEVFIFGAIEITIGAIGTLFFVFCTLMVISYYMFYRDTEGLGAALGVAGMFLSLPFIFFLWAGIGVLNLRPWGRKANLITSIVAMIVVALLIVLHVLNIISGNNIRDYSLALAADIIIGTILIYPIIWFFNLPHIKEQFK
jgi:hypothetical protein